jgi:hypothetical protein
MATENKLLLLFVFNLFQRVYCKLVLVKIYNSFLYSLKKSEYNANPSLFAQFTNIFQTL